MNNFIEVHLNGKPILLNLDYILSVRENNLYVAGNPPKWVTVDESYGQLKLLIWR